MVGAHQSTALCLFLCVGSLDQMYEDKNQVFLESGMVLMRVTLENAQKVSKRIFRSQVIVEMRMTETY